MLKNAIYAFLLFFVAFLLLSNTIYSQKSNTVMGITNTEAKEGKDYTISLQLYQSVRPSQILIYYRSFGESEYKVGDVSLQGSSAEFTIQSEKIVPPSLECYFVIKFQNSIENYPIGAPAKVQPIQVRVLPKSPKDKEIIVLSPDSDKPVAESELFVSISLLQATSAVNKSATKVYIDNTDVSAKVVLAGDMLSFKPSNFQLKLPRGRHNIKVELYSKNKKLYHSSISSFLLISDEEAARAASSFTYKGNLMTESRNENINSINTLYNNVSLNLDGNYKKWEINTIVYVTSEEKPSLQPNNRFSLNVRNNWLELNMGDHNPNYPSLVLAGKRIRGVTGAINLGFFNIISSYGEITRPVEGVATALYYPTDTNYNPVDPNIINVNYNGYTKAYLSSFGTFSRKLFAIHPYFGKGENFQIGWTYLHSSDDAKSINFGIGPQENLVLGTDLKIGIDQQKIVLNGQAAISIINSDITYGDLSDEELKSFLKNADSTIKFEDIKKYKDIAQKFITINKFIKPINFQKLSSLATDGAIAINYFGNFLKGSYLYRGSDYISFANSYLRTNIAGYNVLDRLRLFDNKLFLSLSYESLKDNLQKTARSTTTYNNMSTSVSYYPRNTLPNFLVSYTLNSNANDLTRPEDFRSRVKDKSFRVFTQVSYEFFYIRNHSVSLGFSIGGRDDQSYSNFDAKNYSINFSHSTKWTDKLQTSFNAVQNSSSLNRPMPLPPNKLNYTTLTISGRYMMLENKLILSSSLNPSFGDYKKVGIDASAQYKVLRNLSLQCVIRYIKNSKIPDVTTQLYNDSVAGLTAKFTW